MAVNMQQQKRTAAISLAVLLLGCSCLATVQARVQQMGEIRILAVGDSITQGSVPSKGANHPYTIKLKEILQSKYPGMNVVIDNDGMCSMTKLLALSCTISQRRQHSFVCFPTRTARSSRV